MGEFEAFVHEVGPDTAKPILKFSLDKGNHGSQPGESVRVPVETPEQEEESQCF